MRRLHSLSLLLLLTGCTDLPAVPTGVCGNKVLEPGESCDTFPEQGENTRCGDPEGEHACRYVCTEGAVCPLGWGCGSDGLCRRPQGRFADEPVVSSFRSEFLEIGDPDGDGLPDLLGLDRNRIHVLFQTEPRRFDAEYLQETRIPIGQPFVGQVDSDGRTDVVVPTVLGLLVLLGQEDRTLLSRLYDTPIVAGGSEVSNVRVFSIQDRYSPFQLEQLIITANGAIQVGDARDDRYELLPPWLDPADLPEEIASAPLPGDPSRNTFALWDRSGPEIALFRVEGMLPALHRARLLATLQAPGEIDSGVFFTDVDGDGAIDIVAGVDDPEEPVTVAFAGTSTPAGSGFAPFCNLRFEIFTNVTGRFDPIGDALLATGDFDGDGLADFVFGSGVLVSGGGPAPGCGLATRHYTVAAINLSTPWTDADLGDFNGDGSLDLIAAGDLRQFDVLLGSGTGGFARRTILLDDVPVRIEAGEFDGDFVDDIAVVTEPDGAPGDLVSLVFGDPSGVFSKPRPVGRFGELVDMHPVQWSLDAESLDRIGDLLLTSRSFDAETDLSVAIAFGSTSRQMFAPLTFNDAVSPSPIAAVGGHFCNCDEADCDDVPDLLTVNRSLVETEVWLAAGRSGDPPGRLEPTLGRPLDRALASSFGFACAVWGSADVDKDGKDEVFGVDNPRGSCGVPASGPSKLLIADAEPSPACGGPPEVRVESLEEGAFTGAARMRFEDLDADADLDLLLVFSGDRGAGAGLLILWNDGAVGLRTTVIDPPQGTRLVDADSLQLDTDPAPELVILARTEGSGRGGLYFADATEGAYGPWERFRRTGGRQTALGATDIDGDGVEDLVLVDGERAQVLWGEGIP